MQPKSFHKTEFNSDVINQMNSDATIEKGRSNQQRQRKRTVNPN